MTSKRDVSTEERVSSEKGIKQKRSVLLSVDSFRFLFVDLTRSPVGGELRVDDNGPWTK